MIGFFVNSPNVSLGAYLLRTINRTSSLVKVISHYLLPFFILSFSTQLLLLSFLLQKHQTKSKMYKSAVILALFGVLAVAYSGVVGPVGIGGLGLGVNGLGLRGIGLGGLGGLGGVGLVSPLGLGIGGIGLGKGIGIGGLGVNGLGLGIGGLGVGGLGLGWGLGGGILAPGLIGGGIIG